MVTVKVPNPVGMSPPNRGRRHITGLYWFKPGKLVVLRWLERNPKTNMLESFREVVKIIEVSVDWSDLIGPFLRVIRQHPAPGCYQRDKIWLSEWGAIPRTAGTFEQNFWLEAPLIYERWSWRFTFWVLETLGEEADD